MDVIKRMSNIILILFSFVLITGGCGVKIVPKLSQSGMVDVESNIITKEKDGIVISVQTMEWHYEPYYLDEFFTPLLIFIKNGTEKELKLEYGKFVLIDERGELYSTVSPEKVDAFFAGYPGYFYQRRNYFTGYYPPYDFGIEPPFPYNNVKGAYTIISLLSIPETDLLPNTQIRGFLYFKKVPSYGKILTLKITLDGISEDFQFEIKK